MNPVDEVEVYVTSDSHGRAAIVRRDDGFFIHISMALVARTLRSRKRNKLDRRLNTTAALYDVYKTPLIGVYGTVDDARRELRSLPGLADASLTRIR